MKSYRSTIFFIILLGLFILACIYYLYAKAQEAFFSKGIIVNTSQNKTDTTFLQGSYTCTIPAGKNISLTVNINHGMIRLDSSGDQTFSAILNDDTLFIWNQSTKQGSSTKISGGITLVSQAIEKYKKNCQQMNSFDDSLFVVPPDIKMAQAGSGSAQQVLQNYQKLQGK